MGIQVRLRAYQDANPESKSTLRSYSLLFLSVLYVVPNKRILSSWVVGGFQLRFTAIPKPRRVRSQLQEAEQRWECDCVHIERKDNNFEIQLGYNSHYASVNHSFHS